MQRVTIPAQRVAAELRFRVFEADYLRFLSPVALASGSFARSVLRCSVCGLVSGFYVIPGQSAMGGTFGGQE